MNHVYLLLSSLVCIFTPYFCINLNMTTKYTVKRCNTFGFAQTLRNAITLFPPEDYTKANIFYVHSSKDTPSESLLKLNASTHDITDIQDIKANDDNKNILFIELGYKTKRQVKRPVSYDDHDIVDSFCSVNHHPSDFKHAIYTIIDDTDQAEELKEHKFSNEFLQFLIDLYPHLRDYKLKKSILELLGFNDYNTLQLEKDNPFEFEDITIDSVLSAPMFSDIEVSIDVNDTNTSTTLYRPDKDALKKATLGKATQLDAFSENKFAIIHTKKHAGIDNRIRNQNHDVLDTLAVNGVMKSPETQKPLSVYSLMLKLQQFKSFDVVFIHPSYEVKAMNSEYPCEQIIPSYTINQGEILAIVYRYLVMYFFGYCSIFTDSMLEWRYYI